MNKEDKNGTGQNVAFLNKMYLDQWKRVENMKYRWIIISNVVIGIILILLPVVLNMNSNTSENNYYSGMLLMVVSILAFGLRLRKILLINIAIGIWLIISLIFLDFGRNLAFFIDAAVGILVILLSFIERQA